MLLVITAPTKDPVFINGAVAAPPDPSYVPKDEYPSTPCQ